MWQEEGEFYFYLILFAYVTRFAKALQLYTSNFCIIALHNLYPAAYLSKLLSNANVVTGLAKTRNISTNYVWLQTSTYLGHCVRMIKLYCILSAFTYVCPIFTVLTTLCNIAV